MRWNLRSECESNFSIHNKHGAVIAGKEMRRIIEKSVIILLLCTIFGYFLLCLASGVPYAKMQKQMEESAEFLSTQPTILYSSITGRVVDNFADSTMLLVSVYEDIESPYKEAADSYYFRIKNVDSRQALVRMFNGEKGYKSAYSRYWHGYKVFLAPLLTIFNIQEIRRIQTLVHALLLVILIVAIQRYCPKIIIPFSFMLFYMTPNVICGCLELSSAFVIMVIACIVLLWNPKDKLKGVNVAYLFLFSGITTAYFDFLTAPTITLTVPLAMLCILREHEKNRIRIVLCCIFMWGVGYAGMWAGKWAIALVSRGKDFMNELINQIVFRTSATDLEKQSITRIGVLTKNLRTLFDIPYVTIMVCCFAGIMLFRAVMLHRHISYTRLGTALLLYIPILVSIGWILLLTNHSSIHYFFTHRTLAPTVFCLLCALDVVPSSPDRPNITPEVKPLGSDNPDAVSE